jgi:hypothetical protein
VRAAGSPQDRILCLHPWQYGYAIAYLPPRLRHPTLAPVEDWKSVDLRQDGLARLLARGRIWFPAHQSLGRILEDEITTDLDAIAYRAYGGWFGKETLLLAYSGSPVSSADGATGAYDGGPQLLASRLAPQAVVGSGAVSVSLSWSGLAPGDALEASLRLLDSSGRVRASRDLPLDAAQQHLALFVPWGTPAASLNLVLVVRRGDAELHPSGLPPEQHALPLGRVSIVAPSAPAPSAADLGISGLAAQSVDGIGLLGLAPLQERVGQGQDLPVVLWWSCRQAPAQEYVLSLQALSPDGKVVASAEERVTGGAWPMNTWATGALVSDEHRLLIPAHAPATNLRIVAGLLDPASRKPLSLGGRSSVQLGSVRVVEAARSFRDPGAAMASGVSFGDLATLVGFDARGCQVEAGTCRPQGDRLAVRLVWQANAETAVRYRSFVHALCGESLVAQSDHDPGGTSTTAWLPGQYIEDVHELSLPPSACAGTIAVAAGLYDPTTGVRLSPGSDRAKDGRLELFTIAK